MLVRSGARSAEGEKTKACYYQSIRLTQCQCRLRVLHGPKVESKFPESATASVIEVEILQSPRECHRCNPVGKRSPTKAHSCPSGRFRGSNQSSSWRLSRLFGLTAMICDVFLELQPSTLRIYAVFIRHTIQQLVFLFRADSNPSMKFRYASENLAEVFSNWPANLVFSSHFILQPP